MRRVHNLSLTGTTDFEVQPWSPTGESRIRDRGF